MASELKGGEEGANRGEGEEKEKSGRESPHPKAGGGFRESFYRYIYNHGWGGGGQLDPLANIYFPHRHFSSLVRKSREGSMGAADTRVTRNTYLSLCPHFRCRSVRSRRANGGEGDTSS